MADNQLLILTAEEFTAILKGGLVERNIQVVSGLTEVDVEVSIGLENVTIRVHPEIKGARPGALIDMAMTIETAPPAQDPEPPEDPLAPAADDDDWTLPEAPEEV
jgi:hypothetical protein